MSNLQDSLIHSSIALSVSLTGYYYYMNQMGVEWFGYILAAVLMYIPVYRMIPKIKLFTLKAGMSGKDINKKGTKGGEVAVPEALGIVPATIFVIFNMCAIFYTKTFAPNLAFEHTAGILSITFIIFLGFCDDVFDLPWRYKIFLPNIAALPILIAYQGVTHVVTPILLREYLGNTVDLGKEDF